MDTADDVRLHDLRHSFASFLMNQGVSLYVVQELAWARLAAPERLTQRYAHLALVLEGIVAKRRDG